MCSQQVHVKQPQQTHLKQFKGIENVSMVPELHFYGNVSPFRYAGSHPTVRKSPTYRNCGGLVKIHRDMEDGLYHNNTEDGP